MRAAYQPHHNGAKIMTTEQWRNLVDAWDAFESEAANGKQPRQHVLDALNKAIEAAR
jgi:hypothetical protein